MLETATVDVDRLPRVVGDPVQLRAVLQNLVANAAKFTRPGEPARIAISAERWDGCWRLKVVDHGIGVPPEDRERVFEPLARVDHRVEGSGIGLATVRRVIEAHAGRIGLTDDPRRRHHRLVDSPTGRPVVLTVRADPSLVDAWIAPTRRC